MTDEEMQRKIQFMISLQTAAQEQTLPPSQSVSDEAPPPHVPFVPDYVEGAHITPAAAAEAAAAAAATGNSMRSTLSARTGLNILDGGGEAAAANGENVSSTAQTNSKPPLPPPPPPPQQQPKGRSIMGTFSYQQQAASDYGQPQQQQAATELGVGQGHLYFPGDYQQQSNEQHPMLSGDAGSAPRYYGMVDHAVLDEHGHDPDYVEPKHHHHHHHHHCGCLTSFRNCFQNAEALQRSFCYGSIDGLLTGAGIVATFLGMNVLTARSSAAMHLFVVAFSLAACTSDAICMALGHVWSTYILTHASANERRTERLSFESSRADAKAKLVDMLLTRGMLKIDAMSIADTLEGYPDIFISALVGDSGYTLGEEILTSSNEPLGYQQTSEEHPPFSPLLRSRRSYGQFNEEEMDPEAVSVQAALGESRKEGLVMMVAFALFSVIPSVIFLWLSTVMNVSVKHRASGGTSVTSIAVSLTSVIMLFLGIWKSRFFDSHWALFGMETVAVLWLCTLSAYFLGLGLSMCIPGLRGILQDTEL